jgi:NAD(P)-dependent dehydrogenase (short-subunit alcohol dehydrogenase family)
VPGFPGQLQEVDLADREATRRALDAVLETGPADAVVNNVGLVRPAYLNVVFALWHDYQIGSGAASCAE